MPRICYLLLPAGLKDEEAMNELSSRYSCRIVPVMGMDWNADMTPWPAPGVFSKAKAFTGGAEAYLKKLETEIVPRAEAGGQYAPEDRILAGVSLSGLFSIWAAHRSALFGTILSVSGSLWFDGFADWVCSNDLNPAVGRVLLTLGDREKNSKDARMARVQDCTQRIAGRLGTVAEFLLEENTTHFSAFIPRLDRALALLVSDNNHKTL